MSPFDASPELSAEVGFPVGCHDTARHFAPSSETGIRIQTGSNCGERTLTIAQRETTNIDIHTFVWTPNQSNIEQVDDHPLNKHHAMQTHIWEETETYVRNLAFPDSPVLRLDMRTPHLSNAANAVQTKRCRLLFAGVFGSHIWEHVCFGLRLRL